MAILNKDNLVTTITTDSSELVLDPESMIDETENNSLNDLISNIDALIKDTEKSIQQKSVSLSESTKNTSVGAKLKLIVNNQSGKTFTLRGKLCEFEFGWPNRLEVHIELTNKLATRFIQFCFSSSVGKNRENMITIERCEIISPRKMLLLGKNKKSFQRKYFRLDFFRFKKLNTDQTVLELDFDGI